MKLKLRAIGASTGVLLPKAMLIRLEVKKGDTLFAVETSLVITARCGEAVRTWQRFYG